MAVKLRNSFWECLHKAAWLRQQIHCPFHGRPYRQVWVARDELRCLGAQQTQAKPGTTTTSKLAKQQATIMSASVCCVPQPHVPIRRSRSLTWQHVTLHVAWKVFTRTCLVAGRVYKKLKHSFLKSERREGTHQLPAENRDPMRPTTCPTLPYKCRCMWLIHLSARQDRFVFAQDAARYSRKIEHPPLPMKNRPPSSSIASGT